ncbi:hypothetical protein AALP_AA6G044200 [Arabis alpina]|uniref:Uncharacterized protein n=1 Tax=Arabis alpina TaxID=50452 RepID=A0A087GM26_ARAAL|nr:hypothetical protein AALP_AA6G044200 [Arabis alpina]
MAEFPPPDDPIEEEEQTETTEETETTTTGETETTTTEEEVQMEEDDQEELITTFPNPAPGQAPMFPIRPMMYNYQQDQAFPNPAPGQAPLFPIRPMMDNHQQDQAFPNPVPGQDPMMYNHQQDQAFPNPVPGQAPMMYNHQQDLVVPDAVPGQAPMIRPVTTNHNQDQAVPNVVPGQAPIMNSQNQPMANQIPDIDPPRMLPPNYTYNPRPVFVITQYFLNPQYHLDITQFRHIQYPYMRPEDNHQNLMMPLFMSDHMFTRTSPSGELRTYVVLREPWITQQGFIMSLNDAVVVLLLPEEPLQPQTQQPTQSHDQGQDQS